VALFCPQRVRELDYFGGKPAADWLVALFCPQGVRELVILVQNPLLTLPRPCFAISEYVNWLFWWKTPADALVALFCPQEVRDLVILV
jgi:hypothetical protein